ncbi:MAG: hypothetical protein ACFHU9_02420 [Fluviicola sp.]
MRFYSILPFLALIAVSCSQNKENINTKPLENSKVKTQETVEVESEHPQNATDTAVAIIEAASEVVGNAPAPEEFEDVDWDAFEASMTKDYSFVIVISTKSYDAALKRAKEASEKLGYPLDLRGLHANKEFGLSFSKEVCENDICGGGLSYPIYIPRSDWGSEKYVSVEYSNAFEGFTKGYYIVVVASGEKGAPVVKKALTEAKKFYKDAYAKTCGVYMGCGC